MNELLHVEEYVNLSYGTLEKMSNGLLIFTIDPQQQPTECAVDDLYGSIMYLQKGNHSPVLMDLRGLQKMSMQCRIFIYNTLGKYASRAAFVLDDNPSIQYGFNLCNQLRIKSCPIQLFTSFDLAENWLASLAKETA